MSKQQITKLINRYFIISLFALSAVILASVYVDHYLLSSALDRHADLGLEYNLPDRGYIWGAIIFTSYSLFGIFFFTIRGIVHKIYEEIGSSSEPLRDK